MSKVITDYLEKAAKVYGTRGETPDSFVNKVMHTATDFLGGVTPHAYLDFALDDNDREESVDYILEVMRIIYP